VKKLQFKIVLVSQIVIYLLSISVRLDSKDIVYPWIDAKIPGETIVDRFQPPEGFKRVTVAEKSYGHWLRQLPLMQPYSPVMDYQGNIRRAANDTTIAAVINYPIRGKKLEQCMDIIIRFHAEYLFACGRHDEIAYFMPGGFRFEWKDWMNGKRPRYHGIKMTMRQQTEVDSSKNNFEKYLWELFYHSYTQTAYIAYNKISPYNVQIGDFIVKKGRKGHAVMIVDIAVNENDDIVAIIGQGDTPARQFHLLNYKQDNPWFPIEPLESSAPPLPIRKRMTLDGLRRFK